MKTIVPKIAEVKRERHVIDASGEVMGRLASKVAALLIGKHKPIFTPNADVGDFVVVYNVDKLRITGQKDKKKIYYRHSNYPGGFRETPLEKLLEDKPTGAFEHAVRGMIPHTHLGARMKKRFQAYAGELPAGMVKAKPEASEV